MPSTVTHPFLSKTLWTNLVIALVAFFPMAQAFIVAHPAVVMSALGGVNFILRLLTKNAIGLED